MVGYAGLPSQHLCSDGTLLGAAPSCTPEPCTFEGFALGVALDPPMQRHNVGSELPPAMRAGL